MNNLRSVMISAEPTPNPNTYKFNVNRVLNDSGPVSYSGALQAKSSPLPEAIFRIPNIESVLIGRDFISATKVPCANWADLSKAVVEAIKLVIESGITPLLAEGAAAGKIAGDDKDKEVVKRIQEILDEEIRPALAMDGGDVSFEGYENGLVKLHLQGACRSCPSAVMTLKLGVEARLKSLIPEIKEVVPV